MASDRETMVRQQLLLRPDQRRRLERLALAEGRSLSDMARRALDHGMDAIEGCTDEALRRERAALERLDVIREENRARYGAFTGDPVAEARAGREEDVERVWRGQ